MLPGVLFVVFFMLIPLFSLCLTSFFPDEHFSLSSYFSLFGDVYFQQVFVDRSHNGEWKSKTQV